MSDHREAVAAFFLYHEADVKTPNELWQRLSPEQKVVAKEVVQQIISARPTTDQDRGPHGDA